MLLRAFLVAVFVSVAPVGVAAAGPATAVAVAAAPAPTVPPVTANPFLPDDKNLDDCVGSLPRPGCGSEARGGWHQGLVLIALVLGLAVIGWRIVAGVRRAPRSAV